MSEKVIYNYENAQIDQAIDKAKDEIIKTLKEIIAIQENQIRILKEQNAECSKTEQFFVQKTITSKQ